MPRGCACQQFLCADQTCQRLTVAQAAPDKSIARSRRAASSDLRKRVERGRSTASSDAFQEDRSMLLLKQQREAGKIRLTGGKTAYFFKEKVARLRSEAAFCCAMAMRGR
jgi:hypothetical protein